MKTHAKTKSDIYKNITIEDESGMDTFRVKKSLFLEQLASHLRQMSAVVVPVKVLA